MIKRNLNIPAVLVHTMKGKQYKLNGMILSINESNDTCTMRFKGNIIENNIPMNKLFISEGFLDKIKEYGKKAVSYISKKIKGFIALVDEATGKFFPWSVNNIANIAIQASRGMLPEGVYFAPSKTLQGSVGVKGISIDEAFAESESKDINMINNYWKQVIRRAGTTSDTIEESVKYVNKKFYKLSPSYKQALNESVVYSYDAIKYGKGEKATGDYGVAVKSKQLKAQLKDNIRKQISGPLGGHADIVPLMIWGAPGIGKTAIIKQTIKEMAQSKYKAINLNLEVIMLAGYTIENWTLPDINQNSQSTGVELRRFSDVPKAWLPVYLDTPDIEEKKRRDEFCNTSKFLNPEAFREQTNRKSESGEKVGFMAPSNNSVEFEGGVVFMDEYSRVMPNVQNIIMGLANDHKFGDNYVVASKWGFVFASNRSIDEGEADSDDPRYYPTAAQTNRFTHVTYVPDKMEWLAWARQINERTGEANVEPFITDFIEASPDHVWYATVTNGGYDDLLENPKVNKLAHQSDNGRDEVQSVLDQAVLKTKRMVTPRTWANVINNEYRLELQSLLDNNPEGIDGKDYYYKLVQQSKRQKVDKNGVEYTEWAGGILPELLKEALNNIDSEYWDEWYEEHGGDEVLNPGGQFRGVNGRYNILMTWFIDMVRYKIGDDSGTNSFTASSPLMNSWRDYQSFAKHFTASTYNSIWETGKLPEKYQKDDDRLPLNISDFSNTEYSKWKRFTNIRYNVMENLWDSYPGNLQKELKSDLKRLNSGNNNISDKEALAEYNKYVEQFCVKIGTDKVYLLNNNVSANEIDLVKNIVYVLKNSVIALRFANFATWVSKIAMQTETQADLKEYKTKMLQLLNDCDSDDARAFLNKEEIAKLNAQLTKNGKTPQLLKEYHIANTKIGIFVALTIFETALKYNAI